ncbi:MAG: hypothetical protein V3T72_17680 [Thermoanaerobaculia bacterium]
MSDILFRYLLMARRRDRSFFRRLLVHDEQLLEAGVEQLVESAAARVAVRSQHERVGNRSVEVPASHQHRVRFYDVAQPNRPTPGKFEKRREEFPLSATLEILTCTDCSGSGEVRCGRCRGRGKVRCRKCSGSGNVNDGHKSYTCGSCNGSGTRTCSRCHGSGWRTCRRCDGEGQLARWDAEVYEWLIENRSGEEYPLENRRLRGAFKAWLEIDEDRVENLEPATAAEHLGFDTPEAMEVVARADATRQSLEDEARRSSDTYLFHRSDCSLSPAGYTVVRLQGTARFYWLVGRGEKALEVRPKGRLDGVKMLGWLGLGSGGALTWEFGVRAMEFLTLEVLDPLQLFLWAPELGLWGGAAASGFLVASGARRLLHHQPPVTTVGLLPATGEPTSWLTCLAYLGSYTERLTVLDRAYDTQLERLLGKMRPKRQSESLTVELLGGRRIRLVEVAQPARLSDGQLRFTLQALDGVMILEEKDQPGSGLPGSGLPADELEARLRTIAATTSDTTPIVRVAIDRTADRVTAEAEAVPLEAIRRAFVEDLRGDAGWDRQFDRLWNPFEHLLIAAAATGRGR